MLPADGSYTNYVQQKEASILYNDWEHPKNHPNWLNLILISLGHQTRSVDLFKIQYFPGSGKMLVTLGGMENIHKLGTFHVGAS